MTRESREGIDDIVREMVASVGNPATSIEDAISRISVPRASLSPSSPSMWEDLKERIEKDRPGIMRRLMSALRGRK